MLELLLLSSSLYIYRYSYLKSLVSKTRLDYFLITKTLTKTPSFPGHLVFRVARPISKELYIISVTEVGRHGGIRIRLYNHHSGHEQEMRLSALERLCLVDSLTSADWRVWSNALIQRLTIRDYVDEVQEGEGEARLIKEVLKRRVVLDRRVFWKVKRDCKRVLRLAVYVKERGTSVLACFTIEKQAHKYVREFAWEELVRATSNEWSQDKTSITDYAASLSPGDIQSLYENLLNCATYSPENDAIVLSRPFAGVEVRTSSEVAVNDFSATAYMSEDIGDYKPKFNQPEYSLALEGLNSTEDMRHLVQVHSRQLPTVIYQNEIGEKVPVVFFPPREGAKGKEKESTEGDTNAFAQSMQSVPPPADPGATVTFEGVAPKLASHFEGLPRKQIHKGDSIETLIFNKGVKVLLEFQNVRTWYSNVNLRIFSSIIKEEENVELKGQRRLRLVVYRVTSSAYSEGVIEGFDDLREVVGTLYQDLLSPNREEEMFLHMAHNRITVMEGLWNPLTDRYEPENDEFTLLLKRDRLYMSEKETPIHLGGDADMEFNKQKLIRDKVQRGRKILRHALKVDGTLLHLSVFELPGAIEALELKRVGKPVDFMTPEELEEHLKEKKHESLPIPKLRIVSFDPRTCYKCVLVPPAEAILENIGGPVSPLLEPARRLELARALSSYLSLKLNRETSKFDIFLPWSGDKTTAMIRGKNQKLEEELLSLPGKLTQSTVQVDELKVVVTVFKIDDTSERARAIRINFCCTRIDEAVDLVVTEEDQVNIIGKISGIIFLI